MLREMWKAVETKVQKVRVVEAEEGWEKRRGEEEERGR